jgi:hypothetical protein
MNVDNAASKTVDERRGQHGHVAGKTNPVDTGILYLFCQNSFLRGTGFKVAAVNKAGGQPALIRQIKPGAGFVGGYKTYLAIRPAHGSLIFHKMISKPQHVAATSRYKNGNTHHSAVPSLSR